MSVTIDDVLELCRLGVIQSEENAAAADAIADSEERLTSTIVGTLGDMFTNNRGESLAEDCADMDEDELLINLGMMGAMNAAMADAYRNVIDFIESCRSCPT